MHKKPRQDRHERQQRHQHAAERLKPTASAAYLEGLDRPDEIALPKGPVIDRILAGPGTLYVAAKGWEQELEWELSIQGPIDKLAPQVFWHAGPARSAAWAQNVWFETATARFATIAEASQVLRQAGPWWTQQPIASVRRGALIQEKLLVLKDLGQTFPLKRTPKALGAYALLSEDLLFYSRTTQRPFPEGQANFAEDHVNPPGRAYMKLWESLTLLGELPAPGTKVLDLGACPGSWTWTLANLGCQVTAIDKTCIDAKVLAMPGVTWKEESAFAVEAKDFPDFEWLFSDVVCYPERLVKLIERWWDHPRCKRMIITVKFQGRTDLDVLAAFRKFPGSTLLHLTANKHEVTWIRHPGLGDHECPVPRPWPWIAARG